SENVTLSGNWFQIVCGTSGTHDTGNSSIIGGPLSYTINPTDFTQGESCTATIFAADVADNDANDPPDNIVANYVFSFTIDAAPLTSTRCSVTVGCASTGAHTVSVSGGPTTWSVDPASDFGNGELCTATVFAAEVSDNDSNDPPDNMLANFVWTFTTDNPPSVTATTPTNATTTPTATNVTAPFDGAPDDAPAALPISFSTSGGHELAPRGGATTTRLA